MAISFVGVGAIASANSLIGTTGQVADVPSGVVDDDFLIIFSHNNGSVGTFDALTGWTKQTAIDGQYTAGTDFEIAIYTRVASSEPANYTVTHSDTVGEQWSTAMVAYRGVDTSTPLDVTPISGHRSDVLNKASPNVDAFNSITTVTNDAWVLAFEAVTHDEITSNADPSGYTNRFRNIGLSHPQRQMQLWDTIKATAGAEAPGAPAYTSSGTIADASLITMALRPAANSSFMLAKMMHEGHMNG